MPIWWSSTYISILHLAISVWVKHHHSWRLLQNWTTDCLTWWVGMADGARIETSHTCNSKEQPLFLCGARWYSKHTFMHWNIVCAWMDVMPKTACAQECIFFIPGHRSKTKSSSEPWGVSFSQPSKQRKRHPMAVDRQVQRNDHSQQPSQQSVIPYDKWVWSSTWPKLDTTDTGILGSPRSIY